MSWNGPASCFHPRWLIAALASTLCVLALTHIPQDALPPVLQQKLFDKIEHVVAYALVAAFFVLSLRPPVRPALLAAVVAVLAVVGALDEVTQPLVNRYASVVDYAADLVGIALACTIPLLRRSWNGRPTRLLDAWIHRRRREDP